MRRIAASLVYPVSSPPLKNGMVTVEHNGIIISVEEGGENFRELAGVEYYSGILIPGFADVHTGERDSAWLLGRGIRVAGRTGFPKDAGKVDNELSTRFSWKSLYGGRVDYQIFKSAGQFSGCFMPGRKTGVYHARGKSNKYLAGGKGPGINGFYRAGTEEGLLVIGTSGRLEMIKMMIGLQEEPSGTTLLKLIDMATINGAVALGYDKVAGCLLPGRQPGLNLIEGADMSNLKLLPGSRLRRLC